MAEKKKKKKRHVIEIDECGIERVWSYQLEFLKNGGKEKKIDPFV